jgi:phosphoribosyl-AMP cyclohydrolase / phosphoribosyl-ATP pyrophosphohydrolase
VWVDELSYDPNGLVPVVTQDVSTGEVLMVAFANREALLLTLTSGEAHYWSRSRQELWRKGATSGNLQEVEEVRVDCDADAVLYRVRPSGPACHTGQPSCFHRAVEGAELAPASAMGHILGRLGRVVEQRDLERPAGSYTTYLFEQGIDKILKKLGEEATETVIAAKNADLGELRYEAADLLYHLLVLLRAQRLPLEELWAELEARFAAPATPVRIEPNYE